MLTEQLRTLGLSKTEADAYLFLLENGLSSPSMIAKGIGIQRTNCYHILESLEAQQLIQSQQMGKRSSYLARDPEALYKSLELKREMIQSILPDLRGIYTVQKHKPKVQFYEGKAQLEEAYWRSLDAREIFAIGSSQSLATQLPDLYRRYIKEIKQRGIVFHDILTNASMASAGPQMQETLKGLYDVQYLPKEYADVPSDCLIWNDSIAHITLEEPYFATVLTSSVLATTMKTVFRVMRAGLERR